MNFVCSESSIVPGTKIYLFDNQFEIAYVCLCLCMCLLCLLVGWLVLII